MDNSMNSSNSMGSMGNSSSMNNSTGMPTGNSGTMNNSMGMLMGMTPWLHFGNGDHVLFEAWSPSSDTAVAGACIGLFLFGILERSLAAYRRNRELHWSARTCLVSRSTYASASKVDRSESSGDVTISAPKQRIPPFTLSHDISRGVIQAFQSTFAFALMLVVMTYNAGYIIAIVLGLGIGEVLFGRIGRGRQDVDI